MSQPISDCMIYAAARDEAALKRLIEAMLYNTFGNLGIYTKFPCRCDPPCERPLPNDMQRVERLVNEALDEERERRRKHFEANPIKFDKWIFPIIKNMHKMPSIDELRGT
jgi:hypothetical protein